MGGAILIRKIIVDGMQVQFRFNSVTKLPFYNSKFLSNHDCLFMKYCLFIFGPEWNNK